MASENRENQSSQEKTKNVANPQENDFVEENEQAVKTVEETNTESEEDAGEKRPVQEPDLQVEQDEIKNKNVENVVPGAPAKEDKEDTASYITVLPPKQDEDKMDTGSMIVASVKPKKKRFSLLAFIAWLRSKFSRQQTREIATTSQKTEKPKDDLPGIPEIENATGEMIVSTRHPKSSKPSRFKPLLPTRRISKKDIHGPTRRITRKNLSPALEAPPELPEVENATGEMIVSTKKNRPKPAPRKIGASIRRKKITSPSLGTTQRLERPRAKTRKSLNITQDIPMTRLRRPVPLKPSIRKNKVAEKLQRIQDRKPAKKVMRYLRAGMWVMLNDMSLQGYRNTGTVEYRERFLAPDKKGRMVFVKQGEALRKNGVALKITLVKKFPQSETVATLETFAAKYRKKSDSPMSYVEDRTFETIAYILAQKPSALRPRFKHPYQPRPNTRCGEIIAMLEKFGKNVRSGEFHSRLQKFAAKYSDPKASGQLIKASEITPMVAHLPAHRLDKYFVDLRKRLSIGETIENIEKILERIEKPYFDIRITAQLLSGKEDWLNKISPPISVGMRRVDLEGDLAKLKKNMFEGFFSRYRPKIEELVTGALVVNEISKDYAQKNQPGTRTQELENLLRPFSELKLFLKERGKKYPNIDGKMKAISVFSYLLMTQLLLLAFLCLLHGTSMGDRYTASHLAEKIAWPEFFPGFSARQHFDIIGTLLAGWSLVALGMAMAISRRRGRIFLWINYLLWLAFCIFIFQIDTTLGMIQLPWMAIAVLISLFLLSPRTASHFYPEFGRLNTTIPAIWKMLLILTAMTVCANVVYISKFIVFN